MNKVLFREFTDTSSAVPIELDLLSRHDLYFETRAAVTPEMVAVVHQVRYQVYCLEQQFESTDQHVNGLEMDEFDRHSMHGLLFHRPTGDAIGTVRLIVPQHKDGKASLPIAGLLAENGLDLADYVAVDNAVEVSRFAISKSFRRRSGDERDGAPARVPARGERERRGNLPCLSLIQFLLRQSLENGVTYWTAVMEEKLQRMLDGIGIHFHSIGPMVLHHGLRQPSYCYLPQMLEEVKTEHRKYWNVITNGGELADRIKHLAGTEANVHSDRKLPPGSASLAAKEGP